MNKKQEHQQQTDRTRIVILVAMGISILGAAYYYVVKPYLFQARKWKHNTHYPVAKQSSRSRSAAVSRTRSAAASKPSVFKPTRRTHPLKRDKNWFLK